MEIAGPSTREGAKVTDIESDRVLILLATFNGARFLKELLRSIERQTHNNWSLLVRDDLSTDATVEILLNFSSKHPGRVKLVEASENIGSKKNFSSLFENITCDQYIMFCDQDDVWLDSKIELSLGKIKSLEQVFGNATPILVHTDLKVVDEGLSLSAPSFWKCQGLDPRKSKKLNFLLCQNYITGCTVMLNRSLAVKTKSIPSLSIMHDYWISLVCVCFGVVEFIDEAPILYRQHRNNEIGAKPRSLYALLKKLLGLLRGEGWEDYQRNMFATLSQAKCFLDIYYDDLPDKERSVIEAYLGLPRQTFFQKRALLFKHRFFKSNVVSNLAHFVRI